MVTLPLGVLKAEARRSRARWPSLPRSMPSARRSASLESGHVCKLVLRFRDRFWDEKAFLAARLPPRRPAPEGGPINFWHDPDAGLSHLVDRGAAARAGADRLGRRPARRSLLGRPEPAAGPRASTRSAGIMRVRAAAAGSAPRGVGLARLARGPLQPRRLQLRGVGGESAAEALARPLGETLFFAGEATDADDVGDRTGRARQRPPRGATGDRNGSPERKHRA